MPEWLEFPEFLTIPLADWIDNVMHWVLINWGGFFDVVGDVILQMLLGIERFLLWLPWFVLVLVVGIIAWRVMHRWWADYLWLHFWFSSVALATGTWL